MPPVPFPQSSAREVAFKPHNHDRCARTMLSRADELAGLRGVRLTPVRRRTLEILLEAHRAVGAYEVLDRLAADGFGHQPPVAYRALDFLVEQGLVHRISRLNAFLACTHPGDDHAPAFLICRACSAVAEIPGDEVRAALAGAAAAAGFKVERAAIEATGLCPACAEAAR